MTDTLRVSSIAADVLWQRPAWDALITDPPPAANPEPRLSEGIYLVEVTAVTDGAGSTTTLRFTDSSLAYATRPAEVPPNAPYNPALISPGYIERAISVGAARVALGEILIASAGGLDYLLDLGLDGQAVIIRRGPHKGVYPDDFPIQLRGTMEQPEISATQVRLRLRDRMSELEKPLQAAYYGGSNALPDGIDGTADDIKGRAKPRIYGKVRNVEPVQVNTAKLIWQVNDGPIASVPAVYVRGAQLTGGAVYADLADLYANAPAPGTYRAWLAGGLFRLGSSPDGQVTCDATETASLYAGTLIQRIAEDAGIDPADISAADAAALDAAAPYALGVAVTDGETALSALARVASEEKRRAALEEAERLRLEAEAAALKDETKELARYRSEFFGKLSEVLAGREGVRVVGDRFVFSSEVLFEPASADLAPEGRSQIAGVVSILQDVAAAIPPGIDWIIRVDGHTDATPLSGLGKYRDNWELSQARALSVVRYMQDELGFPPDRLAATGFGQYRPVAEGDSPEALAQNRRIELKLTER